MREGGSAHCSLELSPQVFRSLRNQPREPTSRKWRAHSQGTLSKRGVERGTQVALERLPGVEMGIFQGSTRTWMYRES